jgi:peptidoglycan hydrolase-like protein with peptidoglycan-binding domain
MTTNFDNFRGAAIRVDQIDIAVLAHRLDVTEDHMQAVKEVEAGRSGFDSSGRPKMLFEPHVFYRNLSGGERDAAVSRGLAYRVWRRDYPSDSYPILVEAMAVNETAALRSSSWGAGQILGENHEAAGFSTPQRMVRAFMEDEENHYEAMVAFILANNLDDDLRRSDWRGFARGYNGSQYATHGYHTKLEQAYRRWAGTADAVAPVFADPANVGLANGDAMMRVQQRLRDLGYFEAGSADGVWGFKTRAAVLAFRADNGLRLIAAIDDQLLASIATATPRPTSLARATATVADLRDSGSETIATTDAAAATGRVAVAGGGVLGGLEVFDMVSERSGALSGFAESVQPVLAVVQANIPLILIVGGAFVVWQMLKAQKARLADHREGRNVGR